MKIVHIATQAEVKEERRQRYLQKWPIEKQLEAYAEAAAGRPEKQKEMLEDFATIRDVLQFCEEDQI